LSIKKKAGAPKPATLDGTIVGLFAGYAVITITGKFDTEHKPLYDTKIYRKNLTFKAETPDLKEIRKMTEEILPYRGFDEYWTRRDFYRGNDPAVRIYDILNKKEFDNVAKLLKSKYPQLYGNTDFKRISLMSDGKIL